MPYQLTTTGKLGEARRTIMGKEAAPASNEEQLVTQAETLTQQAIQKIDTFFNTKWPAYRKQVEATPMKLFKD